MERAHGLSDVRGVAPAPTGLRDRSGYADRMPDERERDQGRVRVRRFTGADLADFLAYQGLPEVRQHQPGTAMTAEQVWATDRRDGHTGRTRSSRSSSGENPADR